MASPAVVSEAEWSNFLQALSVPTAEAVKHLHQLQKDPEGWSLAARLLQTASPACQFYGAHTLQVKLSRDWASLPESERLPLRDQLLRWLLAFAHGPHNVVTKLCQALTTLSQRLVTAGVGSGFITYTLDWLRREGRDESVNRIIIDFLTILPEETLHQLDTSQASVYHHEIQTALPLILDTCFGYLGCTGRPEAGLQSPAYTRGGALEPDVGHPLQEATLRCLTKWVAHHMPLESLPAVLDRTFYFLPYETTRDAASELLQAALDHPKVSQIQATVTQRFLVWLDTPWLRDAVQTTIADTDEDAARVLCNLLLAFAEGFTDFILTQLQHPAINNLLEYLLRYTDYPGYFGHDQEISELPLNFWYLFQEGIADFDMDSHDPDPFTLIPSTGDLAGSYREANPAVGAPLPPSGSATGQLPMVAIRAFFRNLVHTLTGKLVYPPLAEWASWPKDIRERFRAYRRDLGDIQLACYYVLREEMLGVIFNILDTLTGGCPTAESLGPTGPHGRPTEAVLFTLRCVQEAVPVHESTYLRRLFAGPFQTLVGESNYTPLQVALLHFIGAYAEWLNYHPDLIIPALRTVTQAFTTPALASAAALAFRSLCDTCKEHLKSVAPDVIESVINISSHIPSTEKAKAFESMCDLLLPLPPEHFEKPFFYLVGNLLSATLALVQNHQGLNSDDQRSELLTHIGYLTACGRGLQPPDHESTGSRYGRAGGGDSTEIVDLTESPGSAGAPASATVRVEQLMAANRWSQLLSSETLANFRQLTMTVLTELGDRFGQDEEVVEEVTQWLKTTLRQLPGDPWELKPDAEASEIVAVFELFVTPPHFFNMFQPDPQFLARFLVDRYEKLLAAVHQISGGGAAVVSVAPRLDPARAISLMTAYLDTVAHFAAVYGNLKRYTIWYRNVTALSAGRSDALDRVLLTAVGHPGSQVDLATLRSLMTTSLRGMQPLLAPEQARELIGSLLVKYTQLSLPALEDPTALSQYPHLVISFFGFLTKYLPQGAGLFSRLSGDSLGRLSRVTIQALGLTDRLSLKTVLNFLIELVSVSPGGDPDFDQFLGTFLDHYGQDIMGETLVGIGGKLPRSIVNLPIELLYKFISKHPQLARHWLTQLLRQDGFPSAHVGPDTKHKFMTEVLGTRSYRKFRESVHKFSMACRNMTDLTYGMY
ncbi:hypothetical protein H4R33_006655 [Dimargaris cristalligena]|nr:hypothetical protein H4R33_006655 [Dimargaris cristalligena]